MSTNIYTVFTVSQNETSQIMSVPEGEFKNLYKTLSCEVLVSGYCTKSHNSANVGKFFSKRMFFILNHDNLGKSWQVANQEGQVIWSNMGNDDNLIVANDGDLINITVIGKNYDNSNQNEFQWKAIFWVLPL